MASSCLTVFGLAYDATEREVHLLFSNCTGYIRNIVVPGKTSSQKPYAFVQFGHQQEAMAAMESRQGTTWDVGLPAVAIEVARRDIPVTFVPRQQEPAPVQWGPPQQHYEQHYAPLGASAVVAVASGPPPAKRARGGGQGGKGSSLNEYPSAAASEGPRTLHLGGLPAGLAQEDLDRFLEATFDTGYIGSKLTDSHGRTTGRAFVGFASHEVAQEGLQHLDGFVWEGNTLRAEWARSEYRPLASAGGPPQAVAPPAAWAGGRGAASYGGGGGGGGGAIGARATAGGGGGGGGKGGGKSGGKSGGSTWGPGRRTLHFTGLPFVPESDFDSFLQVTFPSQVICVNFKDTTDGRPPIAWVLFEDENVAADVAQNYQSFEWEGSQVAVQFARTELDPNKFNRGGGKG